MCGICGIVDYTQEHESEALIRAMTQVLRHRGPDDEGVCVIGPAALGHTRLSIIDLSNAGHQPMSTTDGKLTIVYNGELYNFPDLRRELERSGVQFRGRSDTEVLLEAFRKWGPAVLSRLNGMFAFAVWNSDERSLFLARDRFGIKPLYYAPIADGVIFGSEIKALLEAGRVPCRLDYRALHEYMYYGMSLGPNTMFEGVRELPPGNYLRITPHGGAPVAYWSTENIAPITASDEDATEGVRTCFADAVRRHLLSDVPVGVFLSGGIDSSAITAMAARHYGGRLSTYSVGFDYERGVNELPKARLVAEHFGTDHHELRIAGGDMVEVIERLVHCHDQPFADAANIPLYLLCRALRGSVKVVLQGDGGDEVFAGYRRYNILHYERFWRLSASAALPLRGLLPRNLTSDRAFRFFHAIAQADPALRMAWLLTQESYETPPTRVLSSDVQQAIARTDPFERYRALQARLRHLDPVQRMLYVDCSILLPQQFLEKVDKSTMAHGVEVRVPCLDAALTSYVMALSSRQKVRSFQKKWILRRALRGTVPDAILDGTKAGFGVPFCYWLKSSLAEYMKSILLDPAVESWGMFDNRNLRSCIEDHLAGRRNEGILLWKLLQFALWRHSYLN